ncbi:hypothetical protein MWH28_08235 [Natroniella sulfidigena]|uniref:hypothetical protein n=1 Tax=Natroniella sulfidigena TaxID=723921 RepID=UPI00200ACD87|nr:hypothetical protein [Natroniella sulfidigena]MCK8817343.1 hypothetical protein [Natroniella sulfidigena]
MKIKADEIITTTELMKEIFGMKERLIYNLSERVRYEQIYDYLIEDGAEELGIKEFKGEKYLFLQLEDENYLIPNDIFDEFDQEWVNELKPSDEPATNKSPSELISLTKKAN